MKEIDTQVQEVRIPNKMDAKRLTPTHIIIKMPKVKERILKAEREKQGVIYKGVPIRFLRNQLISQKKLCRLKGIGKKYSK